MRILLGYGLSGILLLTAAAFNLGLTVRKRRRVTARRGRTA